MRRTRKSGPWASTCASITGQVSPSDVLTATLDGAPLRHYGPAMQNLPYVICDVFTEHALTGNPLAVFTDARGLDAETMQQLAREMNLSETTFVFPPEHDGTAKVRVFMPTRELLFAGHPTLGTAYVLALASGEDDIRVELPVGTIPVRFERRSN